MATAARSSTRTREASSISEPWTSRVQHVCNFMNAESARLRNQTIAIGVACGVGAVLFPLLTRIGDVRIPMVLAVGVFVFFYVKARSELARTFSGVAMKRMIAAVSKDLSFKPTSSLTHQQFTAMDLFFGVERSHSRDEIYARLSGGPRFSIHRVQALGEGQREPVFDGVVVKIDSARSFPGHTIIVPDHAVPEPGMRVKRDLVLLKHPAFEQHFSVYSSDYYEARRVVTPSMMQAVMESADALGSDVRVAFVQRFVFVAVPGEALRVKPALFGETTSPEEAVVRLVHLVAFTQRLIREVAA